MSSPYSVYNTIVDVMCTHCNATIFRKCKDQNEDGRCACMIVCINNILKRDDEEYPTKLPKV